MLRTGTLTLPHGITLHCRSSGSPDQPLLVFLHGFPEGSFIWEDMLHSFAHDFHCVAPDLRGYGHSSQPERTQDYRPKALVQDLVALIELLTPGRPAAAVVAHDWGGALAWNLANQHPRLMQRLVTINAPHPGSFLRELQHNPAQQAASQYMHYLRRPDAAAQLLEHEAARLFDFFRLPNGAWPAWLTPALRAQYLAHWRLGMHGPCQYYAASPLVPPRGSDAGAQAISLPNDFLNINVPTHVLWGEQDVALLPGLLNGLEAWIPDLQIHHQPHASHWLVHEQPQWLHEQLRQILSINT